MCQAIPLVRGVAIGALLLSPAMAVQATGFERIEAQCRGHDGIIAAARLLPDGSISRLDGSKLRQVSSSTAASFSHDLDRIDFDHIPSDVGILSRSRDYCLLTRADSRNTHAVWINPVNASRRHRAVRGVVIRLLELAE